MPSYPLSQFSDLEEMMCKVNEKEEGELSAELGRELKFAAADVC